MNIYTEIKEKKGFISALAPMDGVTDSSFRRVLCEIGKPDLFFTEFLNVEGFCSKGREKINHRLKFAEEEKPVVVQLWGNVPECYAETVDYIKQLDPAGIDINMGCSVRDILAGGRGSALIKEPSLAKEIIDAVKSSAGNLPVSVKTRIGFEEIDTEGWIGFLLEQDLDMITVHGRLSREGYATPSRWNEIGKSVELRNRISPKTLIIGNGDIKSYEQGVEYTKTYGLDGFMVGRGILSNPWIFSGKEKISKEERILILLKHLDLFEEMWTDVKSFNSQKKYIKAYLGDFEDAADLRRTLLLMDTVQDVRTFLREYSQIA